MEPTPMQKLAAVLIGQAVEEWIASRRGVGRSWRRIARDLYEQTGGQVDVSHETVRLWSKDIAA